MMSIIPRRRSPASGRRNRSCTRAARCGTRHQRDAVSATDDCSPSPPACAPRPDPPSSWRPAPPPDGRRAASGTTRRPGPTPSRATVRLRLDDTGLIALDMEPIFVTPDGDHGDAVIEAAATVGARNLLVVSRGVDDDRFVDRFGELCDLAVRTASDAASSSWRSCRSATSHRRSPSSTRSTDRTRRSDRQSAPRPDRRDGRRRRHGRPDPTALRPAVRRAANPHQTTRRRGPRRTPRSVPVSCPSASSSTCSRPHRALARDPLRPPSLRLPRSHRPRPPRACDHRATPPAMSARGSSSGQRKSPAARSSTAVKVRSTNTSNNAAPRSFVGSIVSRLAPNDVA